MIRHLLFVAFVVSCFSACKSDSASNQTSTEKQPSNTEQKTTHPQTTSPYPPLPQSIGKELYDKCDFVDYIFYDPKLPMSISLNEVNSIRATFVHIAPEPAQINPACKATGRVIFQHQGEVIIEADFYFNDQCTYYVFMVDQKPTYANMMSKDGIQFFTNNINQARTNIQQKLKQMQQ